MKVGDLLVVAQRLKYYQPVAYLDDDLPSQDATALDSPHIHSLDVGFLSYVVP